MNKRSIYVPLKFRNFSENSFLFSVISPFCSRLKITGNPVIFIADLADAILNLKEAFKILETEEHAETILNFLWSECSFKSSKIGKFSLTLKKRDLHHKCIFYYKLILFK